MAIKQKMPIVKKLTNKLVNSQLQDATKDWVKALRKNADIQYFDK